MKKVVTMKEIAKAANVSIVSVSKALSGKDGVSFEVRKNILEIASRLGYISSKNQKTFHKNIGIIIPERYFNDTSFYALVYKALSMNCADNGFFGIMEIISDDKEKEMIMPNLISENKIDGIVILGEFNLKYTKMIVDTKIPYILLDYYCGKYDSVVSDGTYGTALLTDLLIENNIKKIGFVGTVGSTTSITDRYVGYYSTLRKNKLPINDEWVIDDRDFNGKQIEFVLPKEMPEAFICNCDQTAFYFIKKLNELGYRVPEDISVVGFDDFRYATLCSPELTTYHVNIKDMADVAVNQLINKINNTLYIKGNIVIRGKITIRNSVKQH